MIRYSYRLRSQVELQHHSSKGPVAVSRQPLLAVRLNESAARVLESCREWRDAVQVGATLKLKTAVAEKILANLAARQLLDFRPVPATDLDWPSVSIIVPVRNRPRDLELCVQSLQALDYPADKLEIIVVDDASTDQTPQVVRDLPGVRGVCQPVWAGPAACRNVGATIASGAILAYTDSDCEVTPGWLRELVPYFADEQTGIVGGRVDSFSLDTAIERYESVTSSLYMGLDERECKPNTAIPFLPTANLLIRRELWQKLGGFDPAFPIGEDVDLVWRVHEAGHRVQYVPRGVVQHKYRCRLSSYARRKAFYGGSETFLLRKHPAQRKLFYLPRQRLPFVILGLLALLLWPLSWAWLGLALVAALVPLAESFGRYRHLLRFGAELSYRVTLTATLRNYAAMLLHLCGNVARYYGLLLLGLGLLYPPLWLVALVCWAYSALYDYATRRPPLAWPLFAALYWLELAAHQWGMVGRCLQCRTLRPLIPGLKV